MEPLLGNRFRVVSELGRGGMGVVYRVVDTLADGAEVALKTIQADGPITDELKLGFKEEFRAMAKLRHPNLIEVYDYGQLDDSTQFLTMEIVDGRDFEDTLAEGPFPIEQVYPLLIQLLQALGFIHSRLYVHRDIKPQNIRIKEDGTLKVMDFGLMHQLGVAHGDVGMTGSPGYMAPEVVRGGVVDATADLYAVGCLAYRLIAGREPFVGSGIEVLRAHLHGVPLPLTSLRADVPPRLEAIVAKLLEKEPASRYQDATAVIADLASLAGIRVTRQNDVQRASYLTSSTLVGREAETARLKDALAASMDGHGGSLFVGAPAGVGKSRLVHEFVVQAKLDGVQVLSGHCRESGMRPYEPLAAALRPLLSAATREGTASFGPVLVKLFPELAASGVEPAEPLEIGLEKLRLADTVAAWLEAIALRRPLLLYLDDLQWADPQSLELLNHLIRKAGAMRLLVLTTFRNDETPPGSPVWFTVEEGFSEHLKLTTLSPEQVRALLDSTLRHLRISEASNRALYEATGGNAFFVTEVLRYLMEEGVLSQLDGVWQFPDVLDALALPKNLESTVDRRLAHLSPQAVQLARVAAVLGAQQDLPMLHAVSGLGEEELFNLLDELIERQFIIKDDGRYAIPHARVREALYASMDAQERQAAHQRCGEYLESHHAGVNALAHHFSRGTDAAKAYRYLLEAADLADETGADMLAVSYWQQADAALPGVEMPERDLEQMRLWWRLGSNAFIIAPGIAIEAFEKLIPRMEQTGDLDMGPYAIELLDPVTMLAIAYGFSGLPTRGLEIHNRALHLLHERGEGATPLYAKTLFARVASLMTAGRLDELMAIAEEAVGILTSADLSEAPYPVLAARVGALGVRNVVALQGVRPDPAVRDASLAAAAEIGDELPFTVMFYFGVYAAWSGRADEAIAYIEQTTQKCRKLGAPPYTWVLYLRPYLLWQRGEFGDALAQATQALAYPHLDDADFPKQLLVVLKGQIHLALGELEAAAEAFNAAERRGRTHQMNLVTVQALIGLGQLAMAKQDWAEAASQLKKAHAMVVDGVTRNPLQRAIAARLLAVVAGKQGDFVAAERRLEEARAIVSAPDQDNAIEQAHCELARGELWLQRGNRKAAQDAFAAAERGYQALKNPYWAHVAASRAEAARTAAPSGASARVGPAGLGLRGPTGLR